MKKLKKTKKLMARTEAIELFANNVKINNKAVADKVGISAPTLRYWLSDPEFSDALYKRYMQVAGSEIPSVIQSMIEEAKLGNVQAGRLILEHFGKLVPTMKIQVESNFEKFINTKDTEEVDFIDVTDNQTDTLDLLSDAIGTDGSELPDRDISNNHPIAREHEEKKKIREIENSLNAKKTIKQKQNDRYYIRRRAFSVGLELLPPGRHTKSQRDEWMRKLIELENKNQ